MTEWTIATLKEHFERLLIEKDKALDLQAREYERRLDILNGEHERMDRKSRTFVSYSVLAAVISMVTAIAAILWRH